MASQQALEVWQKKLEYLQAQEAIAADAAQKFELHQKITECHTKIAELSKPLQSNLNKNAPVISIAHLPPAVSHFVGREKELEQLDRAWDDPNTTLISLVAFGGVGKSSLVAAWLESLQRDDWRGAQYVLGHSFYSQGSQDDTHSSADVFIDRALQFFGDLSPEMGSTWDKGERLARLVRHHKTLLILDGMEPLQWGATAVAETGRIKDQGLKALVRELAADNSGLCIITTRYSVPDIPTAQEIELETLSEKTGAVLLKALGVKGLPQELEEASKQVHGHGLALRLLGNYLRKACYGDVRRIRELDLTQVDQLQGGHARKLVEKYEIWLGEGPELSILRLLGLFDRPAEVDCLEAVCVAPAISGLTDILVGLKSEEWNWAISNLIEYGLLSTDSYSSRINKQAEIPLFLDAHPLIREYFSTQLSTHYKSETQKAHSRIYEHLKKATPELPDTLKEMMPLYHAVVHGCKANLHKQAYDHIFRKRIRRDNLHFSIFTLGAVSNQLVLVNMFFEKSWHSTVPGLTAEDHAWLLDEAGFCLQTLGHLAEATEPIQRGIEARILLGDIRNAAQGSNNLSGLYWSQGNIASAVQVAEQCMELADCSHNSAKQIFGRVRFAQTLHQAARYDEALEVFKDAEKRQIKYQPKTPFLYSLQGFYYYDFLMEKISRAILKNKTKSKHNRINIALSRCQKVRKLAKLSFEISDQKKSIYHMGLSNLTLGNNWLLEVIIKMRKTFGFSDSKSIHTDTLKKATEYLDKSVILLRQSGTQQYTSISLLSRSVLWRVSAQLGKKDYLEQAERDLTEIEQISGRSNMVIFQIEAALERCRLALILDDKAQARIKLDEAKALVKKTEQPYIPYVSTRDEWEPPEYIGLFKEGEIVGYHRRNGEIAELEEQIG
ncbi:MAG: AAA family ATPase [Cyanobacteria bacterium P01_D01_bin.156]